MFLLRLCMTSLLGASFVYDFIIRTGVILYALYFEKTNLKTYCYMLNTDYYHY